MAKVAFLGLGVMGYPMAGHLKNKGGHEVTVYNRTAAKADKWVAQFGGKSAPTPKAAAEGQDFVMACVGNDNDLREVTLGRERRLRRRWARARFSSTTPRRRPTIARELHAAGKKAGFDVIDGPVSGGQAGAENGVLTVMCGGDAEPFARAQPVISAYARACNLIGAPGAGQLTKMVNQICIAGLVQGLAEALHFGKKAGLDIEKVIATISKGAAQSWQMENRYKTMAAGKFDFGFAVDWMRKDLGDLPRRGAQQRRQLADHRAHRPVLFGSSGDGRQALGYVEPDRAARPLTRNTLPLVAAKAGTQGNNHLPLRLSLWIPACAGMSGMWGNPTENISVRGIALGLGRVQRHGGADERLERLGIDLVALMEIDGAPRVAFEAGVEEA